MTTNLEEEISTLLDGEITETEQARILKSMADNAWLQKKWHGYHLIGGAIKRQLPIVSHQAISERIRTALIHEPELKVNIRANKNNKILTLLLTILLCVSFSLLWQFYNRTNMRGSMMDVKGKVAA